MVPIPDFNCISTVWSMDMSHVQDPVVELEVQVDIIEVKGL